MPDSPRLPDFLIIGTMKSGTTALFNWLNAHPDVQMPVTKEPNFLCDEHDRSGRLAAYGALFNGVPEHKKTGEASVRYTDPRLAALAARGAREVVPDARLVCVLRDPVERMRSHYRHEVQRGRERREFCDAIMATDNPYVGRSCYARALEPWVRTFDADQLHITRFEDLFGSDEEWPRLLSFLRLPPVVRPNEKFNVTADKSSFSPLMRRLWDAGLVQRAPRPPRVLRRLARRVLLRSPQATAELTASAAAAVPPAVVERLRGEVDVLRRLCGDSRLNWEMAT